MGLFLLCVPLALYGLHELRKDASYTLKDLNIPYAPRSIEEQKKNIDKYFVDILDYNQAKCSTKSKDVYNVKIGGYGNLETYLFSKGYSKEVIDYCKNKFDSIGEKEKRQKDISRRQRIAEFEQALKTKECIDIQFRNQVCSKVLNDFQVKDRCTKIANYLNQHNNNASCNYIMGGRHRHTNHTETWLVKEPQGYDFEKYYDDICEELGV